MIQVSIIIVNYNVRYFLEQCLASIKRAEKNLSIEVIVVDNQSPDDSVKMVHEKFPEVKLIVNDNNSGFSAANNIGIAEASGRYILLLNPDTIIAEETLTTCFSFMEEHADAGAVCVRMIDGSGTYLPESKRGMPTLWASLCKMTGIYRVFPRSKFFNAYYAGNIDEREIAPIEVMTGAFMFLRSETVSKIGPLDEAFFMYGEDIDYSYRILQAGYKNYYLPETTIIHFKGESTRKTTLNYTRIFYQAMIIFVKKHYTNRGILFIPFLQMAVYTKAFASIAKTWLFRLLPALIDGILMYIALLGIKNWWVQFYFDNPVHINEFFEKVNAPFYVLAWIASAWWSGHYHRLSSWATVFRGILAGSVCILIVYALVQEDFRNSRLLILAGAVAATCILALTTWVRNWLQYGNFGWTKRGRTNYAIVGSPAEAERIQKLIDTGSNRIKYQGRIGDSEDQNQYLGQLEHLPQIVVAYKIDEVIFSQRDTPASKMIASMSHLRQGVDWRMAPDDTLSVISSQSKNTQGKLVTIGLNFEISSPEGRNNKRMVDFLVGVLIFLCSPVILFFQKHKIRFFHNLVQIIAGKATFVGYIQPFNDQLLPPVKPALLQCSLDIFSNSDQSLIDQENLYYAKNYRILTDIEIIFRNLTNLDGHIN